MTLWAGRFDAEPDARAFEFGRSFPFDCRLFEDDVIGSIAWAEALAAAGALTANDAATIVGGLQELLRLTNQIAGLHSLPSSDFSRLTDKSPAEYCLPARVPGLLVAP